MCNCGCNTCETKGPLLTEGKVKSLLSEGLQYHIDKKIPLFETVYRIGSKKHLSLIKEARKMYSRNIIDLCEEDEALIKTHLGEFALYEGESVPLDLPMLDEQGADTSWEDEDGNKITLEDILGMTKNVPQKDYPTEKLAKIVLNWDDNPKEVERIDQVEISKQYPILIMADEAGKIQWILDGNHRAQKALRSKSETIPAKIIKPSMLDAKSKKVLLDIPMLNEIDEDDDSDDREEHLQTIIDNDQKMGLWDNIYTLRESNIPSQEEVNKFFSDTQNEMHYLNSKPVAGQKGTLSKSEVEPWDEYDLSNWKSLNRKAKLNEDRKYNQEELLRLDLIARRKFDCDYEKCTDEQKDEILKDKVKVGVKESIEEKLKGIDGKACWKGYKLAGTKKKGGKTVDNCVPMEEAKKDIYDKFLDNPSSPKGRAKSLILKFIKEYGDDASSMAVDRFAKQNNLKPEEKYILKYITKNDIKISSQSGGPDFSAVSEAEMKEDGFPDKFTSDEDIVYLKMKEDSRGAHYNLYYKGYDIEFGGMRFGTVKSLMDYSLQRIVSRQTADKLRFEDAKPLPTLDEAEFKGKEVALGKPKRGGPKAYYVYVKDGDKVKKVTFGSGGLRAKIKNKEARNAFAARHNCKDKKDRTKAGYWSCNLPRYAPALGLGAKMNTFW